MTRAAIGIPVAAKMGLVVWMAHARGATGFSSSRLVPRHWHPPHHQRTLTTTTTTQLQANFLESLQKSFSTMAASTTSTNSKFFTVGITGASGLVGKAVCDELLRRSAVNGKPVRIVHLSRGDVSASKEEAEVTTKLKNNDANAKEVSLRWNPNGSSVSDIINPLALAEMDAVVHLAGENVATGLGGPLGFLGLRPWSAEKKQAIVDSRVGPTQALAKAMAASNRPQTLLAAGGVHIYGDQYYSTNENGGDKDTALPAVDETMDVRSTTGFLADLSRACEEATKKALAQTGSNKRVVNMRFGVVLSNQGGALAKVYPVFLVGGGGEIASGKQYLPFVSARDLARSIVHMLETPSLKGPVNVCAPIPCTNADYTKALGTALNRPTILPLPGFVVSLLFGEMGETLLSGGVRCLPTKLLQTGFQFEHPTVDLAVQSALSETI